MLNTNLKNRKVALIGAGAVGTSFLYSAINTGLAQEYLLIDLNKDFAEGQALDLEDAGAYTSNKFTKVYAGEYSDLKDFDLIVITAGRPQRDGETRLDMVADNAKIMKGIAESVKASGFTGVTVIASNPVDVMTLVYQKVTGYDAGRVISSGTSLDTSRLRVELSKVLGLNAASIVVYVLGEHGDSSVSSFSAGKIGLTPLIEYAKSKNVDTAQLDKIHESVWKKAYEIIKRKRATHYGIGVSLNRIATQVFSDESSILAVGAMLNGEYGRKGIYCGTPCIVGKDGVSRIIEVPLNDEETKQLNKSMDTIQEASDAAMKAIK